MSPKDNECGSDVQAISTALMSCHLSGEFCDLTLVCEGTEFKVHKVVVLSQSKVLNAACTGGFKEALSGIYEFKDVSKVLVEKLVSFLYTANYEVDSSESDLSALRLHAQMINLGELYDIPNLRPLAVEKYDKGLRSMSAPVEFIQSIPEIYAATPGPVNGMRDVVARYVQGQIKDSLLCNEAAKEALHNAVLKAPEFAKDILDLYMKIPLHVSCMKCKCFKTFIAEKEEWEVGHWSLGRRT